LPKSQVLSSESKTERVREDERGYSEDGEEKYVVKNTLQCQRDRCMRNVSVTLTAQRAKLTQQECIQLSLEGDQSSYSWKSVVN